MKPEEKTFALIVGGVVQNIIVADDEFAAEIAADYDAVVRADGTPAYIGGRYVDGQFVPQPEPVPDA